MLWRNRQPAPTMKWGRTHAPQSRWSVLYRHRQCGPPLLLLVHAMSEPSSHFTLAELTHTGTGLPNEPDHFVFANLVRLCAEALEPARELVGPMRINSGYRSPEVNRAVGGVTTSAHKEGLAADFVPVKVSLHVAFDLIAASDIQYDQLIIEPTWIHIGIANYGCTPRRQKLMATRTPNGMTYEKVT